MSFDSKFTIWNGSSPLVLEYQRLFTKLVPVEDNSSTREGECLRAINKIYFDYYNNGFGNNWSGALLFLEYLPITREEFLVIDPFSRGVVCRESLNMYSSADKIAIVLEEIFERVINHCLAAEKTGFTTNDEDMFDYQLPDYRGDYDEDEE